MPRSIFYGVLEQIKQDDIDESVFLYRLVCKLQTVAVFCLTGTKKNFLIELVSQIFQSKELHKNSGFALLLKNYDFFT